MPISVSAKKSLRVNRRQTAINKRRKAFVKAALKSASEKTVTEAISAIDKAAKWNLFHPNKAARLKSRLAKQFPTSAKVKAKAEKAAPATKSKTTTKTAGKATSKKAAPAKAKTTTTKPKAAKK